MPKLAGLTRGLDENIEFSPKGFFKNGRIRVIIINEDLSFKEFWLKYPDSYIFHIKHKAYVLVSKAIIRGKYPLIMYYFNNPFPIQAEYQISTISALDLRSPEQLARLTDSQKVVLSNIVLDAESINTAFTSRVIKGLYAKTGLTYKALIVIMVVIFIMILIVLQLTGKVDIIGMITGKK